MTTSLLKCMLFVFTHAEAFGAAAAASSGAGINLAQSAAQKGNDVCSATVNPSVSKSQNKRNLHTFPHDYIVHLHARFKY